MDEPPIDEPTATTCRLCGALPEEGGSRCPNCGLYAAQDLGRRGYVRLAAGMAGIYLLTTLLVLLTRSR